MTGIGVANAYSTTAAIAMIRFQIPMRTAPTIDGFLNLTPTNGYDGVGSFSSFALSAGNTVSSTTGLLALAGGSSNLNVRGSYVLALGAGGYIAFSAEL